MRTRVLIVPSVLLSAVMACSILGGGGDLPDVSQAIDPSTEPVRVSFSVDNSRAVSAEIPVEGGTLTATGADGAVFTLVIPSGALLQTTTITMTPITSMEGLPTSGGLAAAVQLQPDGLNFYEIATLSIDLPQSIPLEEQIPIGLSGEEHNLEFAFADVQNGSLRLQITHFSSSGVAKGLLADLEPVRQRLGGDVEARLRSIAAREVAFIRQKQLSGDTEAILSPAFLDWYIKTFRENVLRPRLDAASESCAAGRLALLTYVELERTLQLLGSPQAAEGFTQEIQDLLPTIARRCITEEYELCRDDHIIHRMLPAILGIERQIQLLGLTGASIDSAIAEGYELAEKCLRFELVFESDATMQVSGQSQESQVESTIELNYQRGNTAITGQGPLRNVHYEADMDSGVCTVTTEPSPDGVFTVNDLRFEVVHEGPDDELGRVQDVVLIYDPGETQEVLSTTCPNQPNPLAISQGIWWTLYGVAHQSELGGGPTSFTPTGWTIEGDELFAELTWETVSEIGTEEGSFKLYHRPQ